MMRTTLLWTLIAIMSVTQLFGQKVHPHYADGRLYVKLKSYYNPKTKQAIVPDKVWSLDKLPFSQPLPATAKVTQFGRAFKVLADDKINLTMLLEFDNIYASDAIINQLKYDPLVEYVERVPLEKHFVDANDPRLNEQWYLNLINAKQAWNFFSTGSNVVIAITDNAIERTHPDIAPNLWVNPGEIPGNGIDDDRNGYIDDINGWDVSDDDAFPDPPNATFDHGTHVAGIASAATNNALGMASIGFSCKIMAVKVSRNANDPRQVQNGYDGILYAANAGAQIINMSWGGPGRSQTAENIINFALGRGCILVAAAGNDNTTEESYPAAYTGVVSVASTTATDERSSFSNYGSWVKISAPGSSILSTIPFGEYGNKSGTSMAAPMVAGLIGLMKSLNPGLPNEELLNCLYSTAKNISAENPLIANQLGAGRIDAGAALTCISNTLNREPLADFTANRTNIVTGASVTFTDRSAYNPSTWSWSFPGGTPSTFTGATPPPIVYSTPGQYNVSLTVTNANGTDSEVKNNYITVVSPPSCDRVNFPPPETWDLVNYTAGVNGSSGYVNGANARGDRAKAMFFDLSATANTHLTRFVVAFGAAGSQSPAGKQITFRVHDGSSGTPGNILFSETRSYASIIEEVSEDDVTVIEIPQNLTLPVSKRIFISVDFANLFWETGNRDTLAILSNVTGQSSTTDIWEQTFAGSWIRYGSAGSWQLPNTSLLIFPFLTNSPTTLSISPRNSEICAGNQIEFDASSSRLATGSVFEWVLPGTNPLVIPNTLKVSPFYNTPGTYKVYLAALGACNELRIDSTVILVKPSPALSLNASRNPICAGETATITASGATTYNWAPSTGLSASTGASVTANPAQTTTYTVSGTLGDCTSSSVIELIVRSRTTSVSLEASTNTISGPTEVTFTATPINEGSTPVFRFSVNGNVVQNSASNTLVRTVSPGDQIVCSLTSSEPCVTQPTVSSNTVTMASTPLPVVLQSFTGQIMGNTHQLRWTTTQEINTQAFVLEQSADRSRFENIAEIAAAGNSNVPLDYQFTNRRLFAGTNFYRLKMIDRDGTFKYSHVVLLNNDNGGGLQARVFPNPTSKGTQSTLLITGVEGNSPLQVQLSNTLGQVTRSWQALPTNGSAQLMLETANQAAGVYQLTIRNLKGEVLSTQRWIINP